MYRRNQGIKGQLEAECTMMKSNDKKLGQKELGERADRQKHEGRGRGDARKNQGDGGGEMVNSSCIELYCNIKMVIVIGKQERGW